MPDAPPDLSLHGRILADIEGRILSGAWPPGHRIPSEDALSTQYGCARMTVNKALTQLAAAGLIERRRKTGSFVRQPQTHSAVLEIADIGAEVAAQGLPYRFEMLARRLRRSRPADAGSLDLPGPAALLELSCRHWAGHRPFCLEERLINLDVVPDAAEATFDTVPPGGWLLTRVPWTAAEHRIRAVAADPEAAAALALPTGAACLVVERRTRWAERPVTFARLTYPGEAHAVTARFTPSGTGG